MLPSFGIRLVSCLCACLVFLPGEVDAGPSTPTTNEPTAKEPIITEVLRMTVPTTLRDVWLRAELDVWQPWLEQQPGYLGRDVYWDPEREEGQLLIHWRSRQEWKAITDEELAVIQARFVAMINQATGGNAEDPVPLISTGQLLLLSSATLPPIRAGSRRIDPQHSAK